MAARTMYRGAILLLLWRPGSSGELLSLCGLDSHQATLPKHVLTNDSNALAFDNFHGGCSLREAVLNTGADRTASGQVYNS